MVQEIKWGFFGLFVFVVVVVVLSHCYDPRTKLILFIGERDNF